ncbi:MAG: NCS2 family permease [Candidatus Glassbacteria bacterium]|nr:NCS2 family permease [Candidatus Glassbacteria bacterium]
MLERWFGLRAHGTRVSTELVAGLTTFMTMSYIIIVQPAILSSAGMDFGAVMMATCISAAVSTLIMGFWANYPVALAPAMGENVFFAYTIVLGMGVSWQNALGMVLLSGVLFIFLSIFRVRELVLDAVPLELRRAIAAGIGAFILVLGLEHAGVLARRHEVWQRLFSADNAWQAMARGELSFFADLARVYSPGSCWGHVQLVAGVGLAVMVLLMWKKRRAALLTGMVAAAGMALVLGMVKWQGLASAPPDIGPTVWKFDLHGLFTWKLFPLVLIFLFMDLFDTIGTLIGVSEQAGLTGPDGRLPRARRALLADAVGTTVGAALGTSTVTSYIESAAGVQEGGRTGLTAVVCALGFLAAIFFSPLVRMIGSGVPADGGATLYPITAGALMVVGVLMLKSLRGMPWKRWDTSVPAALIVIGIPLSYSIADGLAFGFISLPALKLLAGRGREVSWLIYLLGAVFLLRYIFL